MEPEQTLPYITSHANKAQHPEEDCEVRSVYSSQNMQSAKCLTDSLLGRAVVWRHTGSVLQHQKHHTHLLALCYELTV